nr:hypothetical protein [Desulfonatronospira thiodismutans]
MIEITPPQEQIKVLESVRAGIEPISTVGLPVIQGATVTGMHGMGVKTPRAAAVADATAGLEGVVHSPKGGMFINGT